MPDTGDEVLVLWRGHELRQGLLDPGVIGDVGGGVLPRHLRQDGLLALACGDARVDGLGDRRQVAAVALLGLLLAPCADGPGPRHAGLLLAGVPLGGLHGLADLQVGRLTAECGVKDVLHVVEPAGRLEDDHPL